MSREIRDSLIVAVALAMVAAIVLPLQTFLRNAEIYPFSLGRLIPELLLLATVLAGGFFVLARWARLGSVLTALAVLVYLESGPLSIGLPELNGGSVPALANTVRVIADAIVWGLVLVVLVVFARKLASWRSVIAGAALVLSLASLVDVALGRSAPVADAKAGDFAGGELVNQPTVVENVRYSPTRNILVFILDSLPGRDAADAIRTNVILKAAFPGFRAYSRNIGMHECTKRGVPGLVTGRYYDPNEMIESEYPMTMYGTNSVVMAAADAGWQVAFSPDLMPYGYTNLPIERRVALQRERRSRDALAILRQSREVPYLSLFDLVAFRLSPFGFKCKILYSRTRHAVSGRHGQDAFWQETVQYSRLAASPISAEKKPFLGIFHTWGAHLPWTGTLNGKISEKLSALAQLMSEYRAKGIYDNSLIVITTDHGLDMGLPLKGYPPSAAALLWVKGEGAAEPFAESDVPTSHARVAPLISASLVKPVRDLDAMLQDKRKLYREKVFENGKWQFRDWENR